ncbi:MAG TPA: type I-E CRISPR-associated protein Cse2/CasB [Chlorobaculum sp.]|uniref:CRISPR-associated protein, CT1973 family n=1 Tax=Chlorobaculum tepidum (strain ATCC 49652 / DSM 12025 / NBRC 103806 / TLS) TaxID=194439 RepID=Q8KB25_CHLTE|nr:type I-E CRISPR-associated protein Cse2/CasB [Chlorobaculum tepidum]AAM73191.1 CRISPR-associated protein, CT1973 family [Chlorobaculum tepidum TLS]HBU23305.1 type I-E CRISPR-associated protein Cse2/CasB [Chlorobaculum sp.]
MDNEKEKKTGRQKQFVEFVIGLCQRDKGAAAALRRADNPATEYQSWEYLAGFNIDLEKPFERIPYAAIAAAIARAKAERNGSAGIGKAIAFCYEDRSKSDQAKARLRRLLACNSVEEACRILRPLFSLIDSKAAVTLDYAELLSQLLWFNDDSNRIKTDWATDFYRHAAKTENEEVKA